MTATARTTVPFMALERQHESLATELAAAFDRVCSSSGFVLGAEVEAFEQEFATYCGASHCVGVASGTAALALALVAAGVGPGDEVIVPAHTFIASALGVVHAGATPVYADVDRGTGLLDPASAADLITPRTAAIVAVHLYGRVCDMDALGEIAGRHSLLLVEDAAQAHGATWRGRRAGGLGAVACFSFYPSKNLGALGDGGAICTSDPGIAERARQLRNIGQRAKHEFALVGYNERLDGLQAAFLRTKLPRLDAANEARRRHAGRYREGLAACVTLPAEHPDRVAVEHVYAVRAPNRDAIAARLADLGVATSVHYPQTVPETAVLHDADAVAQTPEATAWAREELSLPMFPELTDAEVEQVVDAVRTAVAEEVRA